MFLCTPIPGRVSKGLEKQLASTDGLVDSMVLELDAVGNACSTGV
jgi:hypothetical protein